VFDPPVNAAIVEDIDAGARGFNRFASPGNIERGGRLALGHGGKGSFDGRIRGAIDHTQFENDVTHPKAATGGRGTSQLDGNGLFDGFRQFRDHRSRLYGCADIIPIMAQTLGYHIVISDYGLWLPGDERGHWSEAWDAELGFIEPHKLHPGDPARKRMAEERQKHPAVTLNDLMRTAVADAIGDCRVDSDWQIAAGSIESTHTHLLLTYSKRNVDTMVKWLTDQATKAIHRDTAHAGPV
jgi:hypothetical protein